MVKYLINEEYEVQEAGVAKAFGRGERREDYADAWKDTGNVILVGLSGSGKNELARMLADRTGLEIVSPKAAEDAIAVLGGTGQIVVLEDRLVEDIDVQPHIHGSGKVFYLMADTRLLADRVADRDSVEDRDSLWRELSARLAVLEPMFYGVLHFIMQATQSPEELVDDAMEKIAY